MNGYFTKEPEHYPSVIASPLAGNPLVLITS
jgi:hypothetical protein